MSLVSCVTMASYALMLGSDMHALFLALYMLASQDGSQLRCKSHTITHFIKLTDMYLAAFCI